MSWKYTCPEGHTYGSIRIRPTKQPWPYYCEECDQAYRNLIDSTTGKKVDRSTK